MGTEERVRGRVGGRTVALAVGAAVILVLFLGGLAFSNSVGASLVAGNAHSLHWANSTLGTAALTRAGLAQATTFVGLQSEGLATAEDVSYAIEQVELSRTELQELQQKGLDRPSLSHLNAFVRSVGTVTSALQQGNHEQAHALMIDEVEVVYQDLVESLGAEQTTVLVAIDENTEAARRLNGYVLFSVLFAVPAAAVIVYWRIAGRQLREYKLKAEVELEAEKAIGRAKDDFIAGLSHELRTPLTSIYGFAEVLAESSVEGDPTGDAARIIAREAGEMTRMVDDLLVASRMESTGVAIELSATPVDEVIAAVVMPFEEAGAEIRRAPSGAVVLADSGRLRHVLVNLVSNAVRHGGPSIGIEIDARDDAVDVEVWDDGSGVPEDQIERLFERFIHDGAAPLLTGSVGLGLAVASRLAGMMGGKLSYRRHAGKTCFTVRLPLSASVEERDSAPKGEMVRALSG